MKAWTSLTGLVVFTLLVVACAPEPEPWTRQFGSPSQDTARGVAVDGEGNVYLVGGTLGTARGQTSAGSADAFLRKYDRAGARAWTRQFGSIEWDDAFGVAVDGEGNVYVAGHADAALPGQTSAGSIDAYLRKYDTAGEELWTRQFGSREVDQAFSVAVDVEGNVYVTGETWGALPGQESAGVIDAYLRKYDDAGEELWTHQFGSSTLDQPTSVVVDGAGNVYVAGSAWGPLPGQASTGRRNAFVMTIVR